MTAATPTGRRKDARLVLVPDQDPAIQQRALVVYCTTDHLELDERHLDAWGCCRDCRFMHSYDRELAERVVDLLNQPTGRTRHDREGGTR